MLEHPQMMEIVEDLKQDPRVKDISDFILKKYTRRVINKVLAHCNREDLPEALFDVVEQIVEQMLTLDGFIKTEAPVSSVSRGDTSISYDTSKSALENAATFINDYACELMHYKKMRLPKDIPR